MIQNCFLEAGLSRGDLIEAECAFSRACCPSRLKIACQAGDQSRTPRSSTASSRRPTSPMSSRKRGWLASLALGLTHAVEMATKRPPNRTGSLAAINLHCAEGQTANRANNTGDANALGVLQRWIGLISTLLFKEPIIALCNALLHSLSLPVWPDGHDQARQRENDPVKQHSTPPSTRQLHLLARLHPKSISHSGLQATLTASLWSAMARRPAQIWQLEYDLSAVPAVERGRGLGDRGRNARRGHGR